MPRFSIGSTIPWTTRRGKTLQCEVISIVEPGENMYIALATAWPDCDIARTKSKPEAIAPHPRYLLRAETSNGPIVIAPGVAHVERTMRREQKGEAA